MKQLFTIYLLIQLLNYKFKYMIQEVIYGVRHLNYQAYLEQAMVKYIYLISSGLFKIFYILYIVMPQIIDPIEQVNANTIRLRWMIPDEKIINPTRYKISFYRKSTGDIKEWPGNLKNMKSKENF